MTEWWNELTGVDTFFVICATIGGVFFMFRLVLQFAGVFGDADMDHDVDADVDVHDLGDHVDGSIDHADAVGPADFSFQLFTFQGLTGFFLMFGLVGYAARRQFNAGMTVSLVAAIAAGLLMVLLISWLFSFFRKMQHSGTLDLKNAIGSSGRIYLTVPGQGTGKVEVKFQGRVSVLDAVSRDNVELKTDTRVKVVDVVSGNMLVVVEA
jgi:membrane protein implicated in regulation of membrane protease activity